MDDAHPTFTIKTTAEKFKILNDGNPASYESEDDTAADTDPLTDDDYFSSDDKSADYCDKIKFDNTTTNYYP